MASLKGKVISITGAASGIGQEVARLTASRGATLALADISEGPLQKFVEELRSQGVEVIGNRVNVASNEEVDAWVHGIVERYGRLDGAANVAGVGYKRGMTQFIDMPNDEWDFVVNVNLTGIMYCVRAQLQVMGRGASIVNCGSVVGLTSRPGLCAYTVTKYGVHGLTKTVAREVGSKGIRVNAVAPGRIDTPLVAQVQSKQPEGEPQVQPDSDTPLGRRGTTVEVANMFGFLLSDDASYVTGSIHLVDGGMIS